uniref:Uncharacterized protein n=1 Tax=Taenia asiatica TaxID=60517 RepID=A0A0R3VSZ1_TAEAS
LIERTIARRSTETRFSDTEPVNRRVLRISTKRPKPLSSRTSRLDFSSDLVSCLVIVRRFLSDPSARITGVASRPRQVGKTWRQLQRSVKWRYFKMC